MIVDGRALADSIYRVLLERRDGISREIQLGILVCGSDAATDSFVRIKTRRARELRIGVDRIDMPVESSSEALIAAVRDLAARNDVVVVQLPLPAGIDTDAVLAAIPKEKDVDALNPEAADEARIVSAPVALAVLEILGSARINPRGMRTVVVGEGRLVGSPVAALLRQKGADVRVITLESGSLEDLKDADIVVSGAGSASLIKPHHLKPGVVLIDAGASEEGGVVVGDADPECARVASVFTPVPGGVGPVAVAMIFRNLLDMAEKGQ